MFRKKKVCKKLVTPPKAMSASKTLPGIAEFAAFWLGRRASDEITRVSPFQRIIKDIRKKEPQETTSYLATIRDNLTKTTGDMYDSMELTSELIPLEEAAYAEVEAHRRELMEKYNTMAQFAANLARVARRRNDRVLARLEDLDAEIHAKDKTSEQKEFDAQVKNLLGTRNRFSKNNKG